LKKRIRHKHSLAIRWFHWLNFPILMVMTWSGMLIYWANDVYKLGWGDQTVLKFFPDSFYKALNIPFRLAEGMNIHFFFMWLFALNGICYAIYLLWSGEWRELLPSRQSFRELIPAVVSTVLLRRKKDGPHKFNAAQRFAYSGVILMGFVMLLNGLAIYKPVQLGWLCALFGGYENARAIHFTITMLFVAFFLLHIIQVILHGWNSFRAMITGFEVLPNDTSQKKDSDHETA